MGHRNTHSTVLSFRFDRACDTLQMLNHFLPSAVQVIDNSFAHVVQDLLNVFLLNFHGAVRAGWGFALYMYMYLCTCMMYMYEAGIVGCLCEVYSDANLYKWRRCMVCLSFDLC